MAWVVAIDWFCSVRGRGVVGGVGGLRGAVGVPTRPGGEGVVDRVGGQVDAACPYFSISLSPRLRCVPCYEEGEKDKEDLGKK